MRLIDRAERLVVETLDAELRAQIFGKGVKRFEVRSQGGQLAPRGRLEELLVAAVHSRGELAVDQNTAAFQPGFTLVAFLDYCSAIAARHTHLSGAFGHNRESRLPQSLNALFKGRNARPRPPKEHNGNSSSLWKWRTEMNRNVKMGLLGCGVISQYAHLAALKKAAGVELVAVCDVAEELVRRVASRYEVPRWYCDLEALLSDRDVEAVLIATADQHHVENAIECLRRGRHVLVEKPLGANVEECRQLAEVTAQCGLKLQVGNMKRYDPGIEFAAGFIRERMGWRISVNGWYCDSALRPTLQAALRLPPLRSPEQRSFDPAFKSNKKAYKLITHGCHMVDTLRLFGGEIAAVETRLADRCDCFSWHGLLEFADGAVGHFELTAAAQADWREGFWVHGEGGSVEIRSFHPFYNRASEARAFDARTGEYRAPLALDSDPYERQLEAFARAVAEDLPASPGVKDGIADLKVIHAIAESVETGRRVEVEPEP